MEWKCFPRYWSFMRGIQRSPVDSSRKNQWCGPLKISWHAEQAGNANSTVVAYLRRFKAHVTSLQCDSDELIFIEYYTQPTNYSFMSHFSWVGINTTSPPLINAFVIRTKKTSTYQFIHSFIHPSTHPTSHSLTHWCRDKMTAIFQTTFSNGFS